MSTLTRPQDPEIIETDPRETLQGGRHQIGTLAGFVSEEVAGFKSLGMAGFVGIRSSHPHRRRRPWTLHNHRGRGGSAA